MRQNFHGLLMGILLQMSSLYSMKPIKKPLVKELEINGGNYNDYNSCFMNAALQIIYHLKPLWNFFQVAAFHQLYEEHSPADFLIKRILYMHDNANQRTHSNAQPWGNKIDADVANNFRRNICLSYQEIYGNAGLAGMLQGQHDAQNCLSNLLGCLKNNLRVTSYLKDIFKKHGLDNASLFKEGYNFKMLTHLLITTCLEAYKKNKSMESVRKARVFSFSLPHFFHTPDLQIQRCQDAVRELLTDNASLKILKAVIKFQDDLDSLFDCQAFDSPAAGKMLQFAGSLVAQKMKEKKIDSLRYLLTNYKTKQETQEVRGKYKRLPLIFLISSFDTDPNIKNRINVKYSLKENAYDLFQLKQPVEKGKLEERNYTIQSMIIKDSLNATSGHYWACIKYKNTKGIWSWYRYNDLDSSAATQIYPGSEKVWEDKVIGDPATTSSTGVVSLFVLIRNDLDWDKYVIAIPEELISSWVSPINASAFNPEYVWSNALADLKNKMQTLRTALEQLGMSLKKLLLSL